MNFFCILLNHWIACWFRKYYCPYKFCSILREKILKFSLSIIMYWLIEFQNNFACFDSDISFFSGNILLRKIWQNISPNENKVWTLGPYGFLSVLEIYVTFNDVFLVNILWRHILNKRCLVLQNHLIQIPRICFMGVMADLYIQFCVAFYNSFTCSHILWRLIEQIVQWTSCSVL